MPRCRGIDNELAEYLHACGMSKRKLKRVSLDCRLYHDLGIYGDEAAGYMEALQKEFGVDMQNFRFDDYFPEEFPGRSWASAVLYTFLPPSLRKRCVRSDSNFLPLTLRMLQAALHTRRWSYNSGVASHTDANSEER
jgi:hypothetical protein